MITENGESSPQATPEAQGVQFNSEYQKNLNEYEPPVVQIVLDGSAEGEQKVHDFINSLANEGTEPAIVEVDITDSSQWETLAPLYLVKTTLAVAGQQQFDRDMLVAGLEPVLGSRELAEKIANNPHCLPYLIVKSSDETLDQLRRIGGIDGAVDYTVDMERVRTAAKSALFARSKGPKRLGGRHIAESLDAISRYVDLLKLEPKSTDTPYTLKKLTEAIAVHEAETGMEVTRFLEAGVGEGRVAILLHLLGYDITGVDMSEERMDRAYIRMFDEARALVEGAPPVEGTLARMVWNQLDTGELERVRESLRRRINEVDAYGGFEEWQKARMFAQDRFHMMPGMVQGMSGIEQQILGQEVQAAVFAWNTFNFMGGPDQMVYALQRMYDVLPPNGMLYLEVPDPNSGVYPEMLNSYYESHPDAIYGMVESKPSVEGSLYADDKEKPGAVRYFPTVDELGAYLEMAGFTVKQVSRHTIASDGEEGFDSMTIVAYRNE